MFQLTSPVFFLLNYIVTHTGSKGKPSIHDSKVPVVNDVLLGFFQYGGGFQK